ncbi:hypothetical protein FKM82_018174 [Ascaphus truei]
MLAVEAQKLNVISNVFQGSADSDMDFLKSLHPFLRNMNPGKNLRTRHEIQAVVLRAVEEEYFFYSVLLCLPVLHNVVLKKSICLFCFF